MAVDKLSISFEPGLGDEIRAAAEADDESVSAWLADAARARLRQLALQHALDEILHDEGLTLDDLANADDLLADSFWTTPTPKPTRRGATRRSPR
jgi:hypothetical protein